VVKVAGPVAQCLFLHLLENVIQVVLNIGMWGTWEVMRVVTLWWVVVAVKYLLLKLEGLGSQLLQMDLRTLRDLQELRGLGLLTLGNLRVVLSHPVIQELTLLLSL